MEELAADCAEMEALLASCRSPRLREELTPWLARQRDRLPARCPAPALLSGAGDVAEVAGCSAEDVSADCAEMEGLLLKCRRPRVRRALAPWLRLQRDQLGAHASEEASEEASADCAEMEALLQGCQRPRLRRELAPWLSRQRSRFGFAPPARGQAGSCDRGEGDGRAQSHLAAAAAAGGGSGMDSTLGAGCDASEPAPRLVLVVGDLGTRTRRLVAALAGEATLDGAAAVSATGTLETKYYSVRLQYRAVDVGEDGVGPSDTGLFRDADAVIMLWDTCRPSTFTQLGEVHASLLGARPGDGDDPAEADRVLICVAGDGLGAETGGEAAEAAEAAEAEARTWCAEHGFEHLRCGLGLEDLAMVQARSRGLGQGRASSLLDSDCDDSACRILEALEGHPWPGLARKSAAGAEGPSPQCAPKAPPHTEASRVLIAGAKGTRTRRLLSALAGVDGLHDAQTAVGTLETKYYSVRLAYSAVDLEPDSAPGPEFESASAVLLLWDTSRPETFADVKRVTAALTSDDDDDVDVDRVQICIAVDEDDSNPDGIEDDAERAWCAGHGFEFLRCTLRDVDLSAVQSRVESGRRGIFGGMLDADAEDSALRIVEAMESHEWPTLKLREAPGGSPRGDVAPPLASQADASPSAPLLAIVGSRRQAGSLLCAFAGQDVLSADVSSSEAKLTLVTKYYTADLRACTLALDNGTAAAVGLKDLLKQASGVVLLAPIAPADDLPQVCRAWGDSRPDVETSTWPASEPVRVFVHVLEDAPNGSAVPFQSQTRAWCTDKGFEYIACTLRDGDLEAVRRRWADGSCAGTPLLAAESDASAVRIVEALECHNWPGMTSKQQLQCQAKQASSPEPAAGEPAATRTYAPPTIEEATAPAKPAPKQEASVESMEVLSGKMREVREIADDNQRRERAAEVAMQFAQAMGLDESDSE